MKVAERASGDLSVITVALTTVCRVTAPVGDVILVFDPTGDLTATGLVVRSVTAVTC